MAENEATQPDYDGAWRAIFEGDAPIKGVRSYLPQVNRRLSEIVKRLKPQLVGDEEEVLSGLSKVLVGLELALTGEKMRGRDTYHRLDFKPRRTNRVVPRHKVERMGKIFRRYYEFLSQGHTPKEAEELVLKKFKTNRTEFKEWMALGAGLFWSPWKD